jgi:hypothetical protein
VLPWWGWVLFWLVLVLGSGALLGWLGWRVWGRAKLLTAEIQRATDAVAALEARVEELDRPATPGPSAVTQPPSRLREEYRLQRQDAAARRAGRRAARLPPWARVH